MAIYIVHFAFWGAFAITQRLRFSARTPLSPDRPAPRVAEAATARFSRMLLAPHMVAFGVMYAGIAYAVFPGRVPRWFPGQEVAGTLVIAAGSALMCWSLLYFRSWRFRASLDAGHELATGGPYAIVRHPIYAGMNLLALGSAVWIPTWATWAAVALMVLGSDWRGRAEEALLERSFGGAYREYCAQTARFLPGIY